MGEIKMFSGEKIPLEMHKVRVVQKLNLLPIEARQQAMAAAGNNTPFALRVIDSQNVFAGVGVLAIEAARMRAAGETPPKIRAHLENLAATLDAYLAQSNAGSVSAH